jgi:hypothetical protein
MNCPLCSSRVGPPCLVRESVPACLNRPCLTLEAARSAPAGRFEFSFCEQCEFGFDRSFDSSLAVYDNEYENEQSHSPAFQEHLDYVIQRAIAARGAGRGDIVEIGCGQGAFLRRFAARIGNEASFLGIDPCYRSGHEPGEGIRYARAILSDMADPELPRNVSLAYSRHVIEHVPNPTEFLRQWIQRGLVRAGTPILIETPSLEWILTTGAFTDLVYEHCNYFSETALRRTLTLAGFQVRSLESAFGGQYFLVHAQGVDSEAEARPAPMGLARLVSEFGAMEKNMRCIWENRLHTAASKGPVAVWGAGAKGVSFVTMLDEDRRLVHCIIDLNPAKHGRFVPVSGHPILSFEDALRGGVATVIVMNPNYASEIRQLIGGRMNVLVFEGLGR